MATASNTSTGSRLPLSTTGWRSRKHDAVAGQPGGQPADEDLAGAGRLLEAGGDVDGVADHRDLAVAPEGR